MVIAIIKMIFALVVGFSCAFGVHATVAPDAGMQRGLAGTGTTSGGLTILPAPTATDALSWTYDDSQKGLNGVCSPTNKCGPSTWKNVVAVAPNVNACGGTIQTPVNIQPLDVVNDPTLTFPTLSVTSGGCSSWVQFTNQNVFGLQISV